MKWTYLLLLLLCVIAAAAVALAIILIRRKRGKQRVCRMRTQEKLSLLEKLAEPFGFSYEPQADVFAGRLDAWQRAAGYEALFDRAAAWFHMIFDAWPVYFDYDGRTWLIELWKGQYGINAGAEIGVYHADCILPEEKRKKAHYDAADNRELPEISYCLARRGETLFCLRRRHWWLAAFRPGTFCRPKELALSATIAFQSLCQAERFYEALVRSGCPADCCGICGGEVSVCMDFSRRRCWLVRVFRAFIQWQNRIFCALFAWITRPFSNTADRLLFLYFQLPGCFRRMMRKAARRKRRHCR